MRIKQFFSSIFYTDSFSAPTFGRNLRHKHSLLLGFGGGVHGADGLVVVGWRVVHIRSSSADVHTCKRCGRIVIICELVRK